MFNSTPATTGGFNPVRTGSEGYLNLSQGLPFYQGRSQVATIPEYLRSPALMEKDVLMELEEKGSNLMKILYEYSEKNGSLEKEDVKFFYRVNVMPHPRIYLKQGSYTTSAGKSTFKLTDFTRPTQSYPTSAGNPKVVGNIARIEVGDHILLMFSWFAQGRTGNASYVEGYATPIPEMCKVVKVDKAANSLTVERNIAGSQRTASPGTTANFEVVANSTSSPSSTQVLEKNAFFLLMPRSMKEDEIDAKVHGMTQTWDSAIMERNLRAWGSGTLGETIRKNLGLGAKFDEDKSMAIKNYYLEKGMQAIFGEQREAYDEETGAWQGWTNGLLARIPKGHFIGIVPPNYGNIRVSPQYAWGSFDIPIFNKLMQEKGYHGSDRKILLCGEEPHTAFATMINYMTQNVPEIKSEWKITGNRFTTSGGLTIDVVPSIEMTLNGLGNKAILMDPKYFRVVKLKNYPTDIVEVQNENPLLRNGFIHGVDCFIDLNPDAHWVFTLDSALISTGATYAQNIMGVPHP